MPDAVAAPEAPRITNQEALHMHNEGVTTAGITPERLAQLQRLRRESADPRDFLRKMAEGGAVANFSSERTANIQLSFGGGKAKRDERGNITFSGETGSVEEQLFNEAQSVVTELKQFQSYAEILTDAARTGKTAEAVAAEKGIDYNTTRNAALATATNEILFELDPELRAVTDPEAIKRIVDERLMKDPAFRREVSTLLSQIKLPNTEISGNAEAQALQQNKENITKRQKDASIEIKNYLTQALDSSGVDLKKIRGGIDGLVTKYAGLPYTTESILNDLEYDLGTLFPKYPEYNEFLKYKKKIDELTESKLKLNTDRDKGKIEAIDNQIKELKDSIDYDTKKGEFEANDEFNAFNRLKSTLSPEKTNGAYSNPVARRVQELLSLKGQLAEIDEKYGKTVDSGNLATGKTRNERLEQERTAISEMRGIVPKAIAKTLLERAEAADKARQRENTNQFDTETRQMLDTVRRSMRERGFGFREDEGDGRGVRINNRETIIGDARDLAINKDDGLRRLTLQHMGLLGEARVNDQGEEIDGETIQSVDHLNARQRALFDRIFATEGQAIKMKVARDLMVSQPLIDKIYEKIPGTEKNGLNPTEWEEFGRYYKDNINQIVNSTKEGKDAIAQLEAAGIKAESRQGAKILMWLALLLGGGATIASLGGLATIIPALAGTGVAGIKAVAMGAGGGAEAVVTGSK